MKNTFQLPSTLLRAGRPMYSKKMFSLALALVLAMSSWTLVASAFFGKGVPFAPVVMAQEEVRIALNSSESLIDEVAEFHTAPPEVEKAPEVNRALVIGLSLVILGIAAYAGITLKKARKRRRQAKEKQE